MSNKSFLDARKLCGHITNQKSSVCLRIAKRSPRRDSCPRARRYLPTYSRVQTTALPRL